MAAETAASLDTAARTACRQGREQGQLGPPPQMRPRGGRPPLQMWLREETGMVAAAITATMAAVASTITAAATATASIRWSRNPAAVASVAAGFF